MLKWSNERQAEAIGDLIDFFIENFFQYKQLLINKLNLYIPLIYLLLILNI